MLDALRVQARTRVLNRNRTFVIWRCMMVSLQGVKKDRKLVVIKFFAIFEDLDHNTGT